MWFMNSRKDPAHIFESMVYLQEPDDTISLKSNRYDFDYWFFRDLRMSETTKLISFSHHKQSQGLEITAIEKFKHLIVISPLLKSVETPSEGTCQPEKRDARWPTSTPPPSSIESDRIELNWIKLYVQCVLPATDLRTSTCLIGTLALVASAIALLFHAAAGNSRDTSHLGSHSLGSIVVADWYWFSFSWEGLHFLRSICL